VTVAALDRPVHGSQNAITQNFFSDYTTTTGNSAYYVSEVGILIADAWAATAYLFWRNRPVPR
jgi:hypothetical protein